MKQIIITIVYDLESGKSNMTLGTTEGGDISYKEIALALIKTLEAVTAGLTTVEEAND